MQNILMSLVFILSTIFLAPWVTESPDADPEMQNKNPVVQTRATFGVRVTDDLEYARGLSHESINSSDATAIPLKLDVYAPDQTSKNRPAFLFIHGGGFYGGSKKQPQVVKWAHYFASRGWVFISIDYRVKDDLGTVPQEWAAHSSKIPGVRPGQLNAVYPAQRDAKAALRWLVSNADTYGINTDFITVGGGSAGAITAITAGISNPEDFRGEIDLMQDPTLSTTHPGQDYRIRTIIDLWGSKAALDILEAIYGHQRFDRDDPSLMIAHGTEDPTVPFDRAEALKEKYENTGAPLAYYPLEGKRHGCWNATFDGKQLQELAFNFIVEQQRLNAQ